MSETAVLFNKVYLVMMQMVGHWSTVPFGVYSSKEEAEFALSVEIEVRKRQPKIGGEDGINVANYATGHVKETVLDGQFYRCVLEKYGIDVPDKFKHLLTDEKPEGWE